MITHCMRPLLSAKPSTSTCFTNNSFLFFSLTFSAIRGANVYDAVCGLPFAAEQRRDERPMVTARLLRAAGACLTICPVVMCGGERGDGRAFAAVSLTFLFWFFLWSIGRASSHFCLMLEVGGGSV